MPALSPEQAADELRGEVHAGRLDGDAVHAVLAEAGHRVPRSRRTRPGGLSEREVEVLRLWLVVSPTATWPSSSSSHPIPSSTTSSTSTTKSASPRAPVPPSSPWRMASSEMARSGDVCASCSADTVTVAATVRKTFALQGGHGHERAGQRRHLPTLVRRGL